MKIEIDKSFALKLYSYARQAERSVDFAIASSTQWARLLQYYASERQEGLHAIAQRLRCEIKNNGPVPARRHFESVDLVRIVLLPLTHLVNQTRRAWHFAHDEAHFISATFDSFIKTLSSMANPPEQCLIELRMDLFMCELIIERHLYGVPELRKAEKIEHFCQPDHIQHFTMEELGV